MRADRFTTVFLDAGGVFLFPEEEQVRQLLADAGAAPAVDLLLLHHLGMQQLDRETGTDTSYWPAYIRAGGGEATPELIERARRIPWSTPAPASAQELRQLAATGRALGVISNTDGGVEAELRRHGLGQLGPGPGVSFVTVVMSSSVGVSKPDPRIFEIALEAAGALPQQSIHVGDSVLNDVEGARAAGIQPLHLDPLSLCESRDHEHIRSLAELAQSLAMTPVT